MIHSAFDFPARGSHAADGRLELPALDLTGSGDNRGELVRLTLKGDKAGSYHVDLRRKTIETHGRDIAATRYVDMESTDSAMGDDNLGRSL